MVARLTPSIVRLQNANRDPITVYIDSRGGSVLSAELVLRLLTASNQNGDPPCRIITVVTNRAASAAADLLSSGDYAIALPESTILYHGVRTSLIDPLTVELGSAVTESLKISNDRYAMALARKAEGRFMFRFVMMKHAFSNFREKTVKPQPERLRLFSRNSFTGPHASGPENPAASKRAAHQIQFLVGSSIGGRQEKIAVSQ
jgi:hypothetical protein